MQLLSTIFIALGLIAALPAVSHADNAAPAAPVGDERCFEMRTYTANPGKLAALHARFRDHTNAIFAKHGITIIGFWTPTDGEQASNTLVYIVAYPSRAAHDVSWKAFREDPAWIKAREESEVNGALVSKVVSTIRRSSDRLLD
jgi:hypothetical protein